jgi:nitrogen-specific signal transduction histidine kinase/HPt (histidine-containing phosphotransfer) domain-containing protein
MKPSSPQRRGLKPEAGDLPGLMATVNELQAELERQQQQLQAASTLHWEFLRHVGHEIRNPMTAIIGMTDLTLLTELTQEQRECLATVQNAARTLMRVLNNMQDYARLQAGTLELEWSGFRLRSCLRELVAKLGPQAQSKGLELLCRVAEEVPDAIVADLRRLVQVLEHLLTNALLYTHRGEVSLEVGVVKDAHKEVTLRFRVRDTGVGMALENATRVTTVWTRPRSSDPRTRSGAGLGLPMVAGLVELFGGQLKIQSQPGQGTECEFAATFLKQQSPLPADTAGNRQPALAERRVLIAVANDTSRRWLSDVCQRLGIHVIVSEPGIDAARACASKASPPPELAVVDEALMDAEASLDERLAGMAELSLPKVLLHWPKGAAASLASEAGVLADVAKPWFEEDVQAALLAAFDKLDAPDPPHESSPFDKSKALPEPAQEHRTMHCEPQEAIARLGGDEELYGDVVRRFREDAPTVVQQLRNLLQAGKAEMLHRTAHSFKGLAAMCGAVPVTAAAAEIERVGKLGELSDAPALLDELAIAVNQASAELAPYA